MRESSCCTLATTLADVCSNTHNHHPPRSRTKRGRACAGVESFTSRHESRGQPQKRVLKREQLTRHVPPKHSSLPHLPLLARLLSLAICPSSHSTYKQIGIVSLSAALLNHALPHAMSHCITLCRKKRGQIKIREFRSRSVLPRGSWVEGSGSMH